MQKVLLLGDSIRMGYDEYVQMAFDGVAEVYYPAENGRFTTYTLRSLTEWERQLFGLGKGTQVDLIHWNVGLWDSLTQLDGEVLTELELYRHNLNRIYKVMKIVFPNAKQVFATSTSVIDRLFAGERYTRCNATIEKYNQAAREVLEPLGVGINDLYSVAAGLPESCHSDATHFNTKEGQRALTQQVVARLEKELGLTAKPVDFDKLFAKETNIIGI